MSIAGSTFRTDEPDLTKLLEQIHEGKIQLPDFQRGWVWDDDHIRGLLASLSRSYPIGAVMLLEAGGESVRFKPRRVQGAPERAVQPEKLILDGQQRMTSLYLALRSGQAVPTRTQKGRDILRFYYLDIAGCLDRELDREDAVLSVPADRVVRTNFDRDVVLDLSTPEREQQTGKFPVGVLSDATAYATWRRGYQRLHRDDHARLDAFDEFEAEVIGRFQKYRVPAIELTRETTKEAVCQVFEKVNTGGVPLTVFELMTATFAADGHDLRKDWDERRSRLVEQRLLRGVGAPELLQAVTLLASFERGRAKGGAVSCKRRDILNLELPDYRAHVDRIERGLFEAARLLTREKVFDARDLPYGTQLVPLCAICAVLGDRFESDVVKRKLARWYWCGVFGELYGGTTETRFGNDLLEVIAWLDGGAEPRTIRDAAFAPTRLLSLHTRQSAAYKGMMAQLMQSGSRDFINGDEIELTTFFEQAVDIHHVFPRSHCEKQGYPEQLWNSVVNKTPLTARTNRIIGGHAPSKYLASIQANHGVEAARLDELITTHEIPVRHLRSDDFSGFIRARAMRLLDMVERAIGKQVSGRSTPEVVAAFGGPLETLEREAADSISMTDSLLVEVGRDPSDFPPSDGTT